MNLTSQAKARGFIVATALGVAALACGTLPAAAVGNGAQGQAKAAVASPFTLVSGVSGRCMDDPGYVTTNGTQVALWDCNGGANQKWSSTGSGTLTIGGKCLDVAGGATGARTHGTRVVLWDCNGSPSQNWTLNTSAPSAIRNASGLCIDSAMGVGGNGVPLVVWECVGSPSQSWAAK
ncbi:ricin-type beta-trefoil lectin domain protein [Streptomyces mobaraensis NBRC 13819 = DSM 40847]|uniref:Ricin B lectin n=1 Tax=Streptomyces mobaraensis (strain ATCC 29032 / DSM 40847 / JCM 4168 / NBRC 13819 / NCIMB 11159 / IPCR 16-22) TaxID=1223523 RepID=M3C8A5_STRM1|nr:RICIN domain-containing protein [Streptomyces mobaraensis]EMF00206.1 ricin B lectin [Streptomyces mobaraensis NBRC 13819 = DSM 40847]QTT75133.1 ricin-type beta-trefoil lectin domain protein [Streptomyces mobaraensis NBRC 13819 = DSM 40847]